MEPSKTEVNIKELEQKISNLPSGSITKKNINGKVYFYHRWTENKKRIEKYIPNNEIENYRVQIEERKKLENKLKKLKASLQKREKVNTTSFFTNVLSGSMLRSFSAPVKNYRKRECFQQLHNFIYSENYDKVFILYGLRRTGKTTMIRQIFAEMNDEELEKAAFIQITAKNNLADVNHDLKELEKHGIRYIFLDEVTLMDDFIEGAALFSDVFAVCGIKIVLSGTDSLGFIFTEDEQLYDRCILMHTTFIPYRDFEYVLNICGIDEYIRYGGTMSLSGINYNENSPFASKKNADKYVNTAIVHNIQHALCHYQYGEHFRHLKDLYEKDELTSAINRVVKNINHRFTLEVLTEEWKSHDLGISKSNLRRDSKNPTDILDNIDIANVTNNIRNLLEIRNKEEQTVHLDNAHVIEIKEYLELLDLTKDIAIFFLPDVKKKSSRTVIAQPGLRYAQSEALIKSLLLDEALSALSLKERTFVQERILTEIKGRMLEDIVLLETKLANPQKEVFVLQFSVGEFDMVVFDPKLGSCKIFEIKHSKEIDSGQYRHLVDKEKCVQTEHRYGPITGKYVLYRGETKMVDTIQYQNVEEYLRTLKIDYSFSSIF